MTAKLSAGQIEVNLNAVLKNIRTDLGETQANIGQKITLTLADGTIVNTARRGNESKTRTLLSGNSEIIDLFDLAALDVGHGAGRDVLGLQVNAVELVGLLVYNRGPIATYPGRLRVGGEGTAAAWSDFILSDTAQLASPATGFMLIGCPADPAWLIADASNHLLKFEANGGDVQYDVAWLTRDA